MAGYKSTSVASTTWSRVKRHLQMVVPVVEPEEPDNAERSKGGPKKRTRALKEADDDSGEEGGPSKKQARGKKAQTDEPRGVGGGEFKADGKKVAMRDSIAGHVTVEKAALQCADEYAVTPNDDEPSTLGCITVKRSDDEADTSTKKGGSAAPRGKKGAAKRGNGKAETQRGDSSYEELTSVTKEKPKTGIVPTKGKGKSNDAADEDALVHKTEKKAAVTTIFNGKIAQGSDATDNDLDAGKTKPADDTDNNAGSANAPKGKTGKNKCAATGKGTRQAKDGKDTQGRVQNKIKAEIEDGSSEA